MQPAGVWITATLCGRESVKCGAWNVPEYEEYSGRLTLTALNPIDVIT